MKGIVLNGPFKSRIFVQKEHLLNPRWKKGDNFTENPLTFSYLAQWQTEASTIKDGREMNELHNICVVL